MLHQNPCNFSSSASALRYHPLFHVYLACGKRGPHLGTHCLIPERHWKFQTGWEFENMLNYSLPDPSLSEEGGASSPQTSTTEASSVTLASMTHRFTRHPEISALGALLDSEIPLHSHSRTPNLAFLLDINQQNIKHDTGFLSATMYLQASSEVPLKYPLNPTLIPSFAGSISP